jgi:hypothetical protein
MRRSAAQSLDVATICADTDMYSVLNLADASQVFCAKYARLSFGSTRGCQGVAAISHLRVGHRLDWFGVSDNVNLSVW